MMINDLLPTTPTPTLLRRTLMQDIVFHSPVRGSKYSAESRPGKDGGQTSHAQSQAVCLSIDYLNKHIIRVKM